MRLPYAKRALDALTAKGSRLLTTQELRDAFHLTPSRITRLRKRSGFPKLTRDGRHFVVDAAAFAAFARHENQLAAGLTLTQACRAVRRTRATVRALIGSGNFPPPLGTYRGVPRWDAADVERWRIDQLDRALGREHVQTATCG